MQYLYTSLILENVSCKFNVSIFIAIIMNISTSFQKFCNSQIDNHFLNCMLIFIQEGIDTSFLFFEVFSRSRKRNWIYSVTNGMSPKLNCYNFLMNAGNKN